MEDKRQLNLPAHLDFLEAQGPMILGAGPLFKTDTASKQAGAGGLWLIKAENAEQAEALVRADPLFSTGLRQSWEILKWHQVVRDGLRQI